jgi:hypothetical protein
LVALANNLFDATATVFLLRDLKSAFLPDDLVVVICRVYQHVSGYRIGNSFPILSKSLNVGSIGMRRV